MVDDLFSWLVPWSIDGCWRLVVISIPIAIILGYRYRSWKKGLLIGYMIWTLTILETLLDVGAGRLSSNSVVAVMDADGSDKELLLSIPYAYGTIGSTVMSPDGSKMAVVFDFYKNYRNSDIYLIGVPVPEEIET